MAISGDELRERLDKIRAEGLFRSLKDVRHTGGWQPGLEVQKALQSLVKGLTILVNVLIFILIVLVPIGLLIGLPVHFILRAVRKHRQNIKPTEVKTASPSKK